MAGAAACGDNDRVNPAAVIANAHPEVVVTVNDLDFDRTCAGVPKSIDDCFAPDLVNVVTYDELQGSGRSFGQNAQSRTEFECEVVADAGESRWEILSPISIGPQAGDATTAIREGLISKVQSRLDGYSGWSICGYAFRCGLYAIDRALKSLQ
jgi:hypothetical protein